MGSVKRAEVRIQDDLRVEGPETVHVVIVTDPETSSYVTTRTQGVAAITLMDNDSECT